MLNEIDILNDKFTIIEKNNTASIFIDGLWEGGNWYGGTFGEFQNLFTQVLYYQSGSTTGITSQFVYMNDNINIVSFNSGFTYTEILRPVWLSGNFTEVFLILQYGLMEYGIIQVKVISWILFG